MFRVWGGWGVRGWRGVGEGGSGLCRVCQCVCVWGGGLASVREWVGGVGDANVLVGMCVCGSVSVGGCGGCAGCEGMWMGVMCGWVSVDVGGCRCGCGGWESVCGGWVYVGGVGGWGWGWECVFYGILCFKQSMPVTTAHETLLQR